MLLPSFRVLNSTYPTDSFRSGQRRAQIEDWAVCHPTLGQRGGLALLAEVTRLAIARLDMIERQVRTRCPPNAIPDAWPIFPHERNKLDEVQIAYPPTERIRATAHRLLDYIDNPPASELHAQPPLPSAAQEDEVACGLVLAVAHVARCYGGIRDWN